MKFHDDIKTVVDARIGKTEVTVSEILKYSEGSIIELDTLVGEPINVYANNKLIAFGEVVVIDEKFGVRLTEIVS
jgi:flagellar motor switch protein FliN/FliY